MKRERMREEKETSIDELKTKEDNKQAYPNKRCSRKLEGGEIYSCLQWV
jgi:hypothetical protein